MPEDDDMLDGCDVDFNDDPTSDEEVELMPLFAEALDPDTDLTVDEAKAQWEELFSAPA